MSDDITQLLNGMELGDSKGADELLPLVYDELRELARVRLAKEKPGQTLQPTALVHEAYVRLVDSHKVQRWDSRGHFFAAAAESMRRILVDNALRKGRPKHGGDRPRVELDANLTLADSPGEDIVALDGALARLCEVDEVSAQVVKLKYFAGLTVSETAEVLGLSTRTADRRWAYARAWLHKELSGD